MENDQTWDSSQQHLLRGEQVVANRLKSAWAGFTGLFLQSATRRAAVLTYTSP